MLEALTEVPDERLAVLLRGLHRGTLAAPLTAADLARHGLQAYTEPLLGSLRGLEERAVRAVIVAVLAERRAAER